MKVKISKNFRKKLFRQVFYIARDKPQAARRFKNDLLQQLELISEHPYSFRKSIFFADDNIRDLIFKGYVITFRIDTEENKAEVFGFYKNQEDFPAH